jgi:hypothetical protein
MYNILISYFDEQIILILRRNTGTNKWMESHVGIHLKIKIANWLRKLKIYLLDLKSSRFVN